MKLETMSLIALLAIVMLSSFTFAAVADTESSSSNSSATVTSTETSSDTSSTTVDQVGITPVSQEEFTSKTGGVFYKFYDAVKAISGPLIMFLFCACVIAAIFSEKARVASIICMVALGCIYFAPTIVGYVTNTIASSV